MRLRQIAATFWSSAGGFALVALAVGTVQAEPRRESAARALFVEARALMADGEFAEACPLLEESLRLEAGMGTRFNLAHCWEEMGKMATAWELFNEVAAASSAAGQREREAAARTRAERLEPRLSYVVVEVPAASPGLKVRLGGEFVARADWGVPFPVDLGELRLTVEAPDRVPYEKRVTIRDEGSTVSIEVPELERAAARGSRLAEPPPDLAVAARGAAASSDTPARAIAGPPSWAIWTAVGGGAVAVAGVIVGVTANVRAGDAGALADRACPPDRSEGCTRRQIDAYHGHFNQRRDWESVAQIGFGAAVVGAVTGAAVLWLADGNSGASERSSVSIALTPGGASASISRSF
jgi:hypothetical protein